MKNLCKFIGIITLVAVIMFSMTACPEGGGDKGKTTTGSKDGPPENWPIAERWYKWVADDSTATLNFSVASDGVCTITVGGTAETNAWDLWKAKAGYWYTGSANAGYTYKFQAWTQSGTRKLSVMYYAGSDDNPPEYLYLDRELTIDSTPKTFELRGASLPKAGEHALDFECADQLGTFYVKVLSITEYILPENLPVAERWYKWVADDSTATLNFSVASDGVCTITVGGTAETNAWDLWKAKAGYMYTGKANVSYTYKFEAWTPSSTRKLSVMYYAGSDDNPPEFLYLDRDLAIDSTRRIFELRGASLPKAGERSLDFECADQLGTFYVKVLSITEYTP
ncbi:MAG: hypothetical protein LBQ82_03970 [Treponema sp.]|jgi:hypothetical protein|nr:hypothetical protein [Treponema sp.]